MLSPSKNLLIAVRAGLVAQGSTLTRWCKQEKVSRRVAYRALLGERRTPAAEALVKLLAQAANVEVTCG